MSDIVDARQEPKSADIDPDPDPDTDGFGWGLPDERGRDGRLRPVRHEFDFEGDTIAIKIRPPTIGEISEYERLGDDVGSDELARMVARHIEKPEIDDPDDLSARELRAFTAGIMSYNIGSTQLAGAVTDELASRSGGDDGPN